MGHSVFNKAPQNALISLLYYLCNVFESEHKAYSSSVLQCNGSSNEMHHMTNRTVLNAVDELFETYY